MEKFSADAFFEISRTLQMLDVEPSGDDKDPIVTPLSMLVKSWLPDLCKQCDTIGLKLSSKYVARILAELKTGKKHWSTWRVAIPELQHRIRDEMEDRLFMFIPPERAASYDQQELFGKEVNSKFPGIQFDLVEAGNCYASGRSTAVVFHLMRIMEIGVREFGNKLGVALTGEKVWQNILDEINKKIKALPPKDPHTVEMSEVSANLYAVKLAWRNEVMHPKDTYTLEEADNLIRQVKIFMQNLEKVL
jgi:hypothetical protein